MQLIEQKSPVTLENFMNVATGLADRTHSLAACREIPHYLANVLELRPLTLAIIETNAEQPTMLILGSSGISDDAPGDETLSRAVLDIHRRTQRPLGLETPSLRLVGEGGDEDANFFEVEDSVSPLGSRALVFSRVITPSHRMLLIHHQAGNQARPSAPLMDVVGMIASHLAKLLQAMPECAADPTCLGPPFDRLTVREWAVLRGLNSDDGEKQLAERLGLSPHTLHSHIKAIYRKVGVQGRLSLLLKFQEAIRDLRKKTLTPPIRPVSPQPVDREIATA